MIERLTQLHTDGKISDAAYENTKKWLTNPEFYSFREQVATLIREERFDELEDAFYTIIPFGTGGRRGTCGVGPNRINTRTIGVLPIVRYLTYGAMGLQSIALKPNYRK